MGEERILAANDEEKGCLVVIGEKRRLVRSGDKMSIKVTAEVGRWRYGGVDDRFKEGDASREQREGDGSS